MKIWKLETLGKKNKTYQLVNHYDKAFYREFTDQIKRAVKLNGMYDNAQIEVVDGSIDTDASYFWAGGGIILTNDRVKKCMEDLIDDSVEYIPLRCGSKTVYLLNIISVIDAADYDKCRIIRFSNGLAREYETHAFKPEKVKDAHLFKILLEGRVERLETFVSTEFKKRVEENGLTGFYFTEVWDSDNTKEVENQPDSNNL